MNWEGHEKKWLWSTLIHYLKKQNCCPMKMLMDVHYPKHQKYKAGPYLVEIIL